MALIDDGLALHVADDDFVRPWRPHEAVVLQHGFCRNGGFWAPWVPLLGHHFRVVRPDLRGCGRSSDPGPDTPLATDDYVDDLFRVLDALGLERVHYVGEATGAFIGMAAAGRCPDRIRSLTLFNTPSGADAMTQEVFALGFPSWAEAVRRLGVEGWWRMAGPPSPNASSEELAAADHYAREVGTTPVHVAIAMLTLSTTIDAPDLLRGVTAPTTFVTTSRYSFNTSRQQLQHLADQVPGSAIMEVDVRNRGGLYCFYDAEAIAPQVVDLLQRFDGQAGSSERGSGPT